MGFKCIFYEIEVRQLQTALPELKTPAFEILLKVDFNAFSKILHFKKKKIRIF